MASISLVKVSKHHDHVSYSLPFLHREIGAHHYDSLSTYPIYYTTMLLDTLNLEDWEVGGTYQKGPHMAATMD